MTEIQTSASPVGHVEIADEVIAIIAGTAALEIDGVVGMAGKFGGEIVEILGKKNLKKGVNVTTDNGEVSLELNVIVKFGCKVQEVSENIQKRVKTAIETMTGLNVSSTNIHVTGIYLAKEKQKDVRGMDNK